jgi:hypothetical protein
LSDYVSTVLIYVIGVALAFMPFILFEVRHNFLQTNALLHAFIQSVFYNSSVVGQQGYSGGEIIQRFFSFFPRVLQLPTFIAPILYITCIGIVIGYVQQGKISLLKEEKKIVGILAIMSCITVYLYITTRNPVWEYHFTGIEIVFLLFIAFLIKHIKFVKNILLLWVLVIFVSYCISTTTKLFFSPYNQPGLQIKEQVVKIILEDTKNNSYTVETWSPSLLTYDYDYLVKTLARDNKPTLGIVDNIYIIIPPATDKKDREEFIEQKTPSTFFTTKDQWSMMDGTSIVKRNRK